MQDFQRESIRRIIKRITESTVENKEEYFGQMYPNFKEKYPVLFQKVCDGDLDINNLNYMLGLLEKIENENLSQFDASANVGQMLYARYVEPSLKEKEDLPRV